MKALIVEPSITYRLVLSEFLQDYAISHEEVVTGVSALKALEKKQVSAYFYCHAPARYECY